jgi:transposase
MLKNGRTNVMDVERSGRPSTTNDEKQEEAKAIILADGGATTEEIALQLGVSQVRPLL